MVGQALNSDHASCEKLPLSFSRDKSDYKHNLFMNIGIINRIRSKYG